MPVAGTMLATTLASTSAEEAESGPLTDNVRLLCAPVEESPDWKCLVQRCQVTSPHSLRMFKKFLELPPAERCDEPQLLQSVRDCLQPSAVAQDLPVEKDDLPDARCQMLNNCKPKKVTMCCCTWILRMRGTCEQRSWPSRTNRLMDPPGCRHSMVHSLQLLAQCGPGGHMKRTSATC
jgi:hypothetical protein